MSQKKTVLVTGATGKQGGQLIKSLLEENQNEFLIRALTRNTTSPSAVALANKGIELVEGDFADNESLTRALTGAQSAYLVTYPDMKNENKESADGIRFVDAAKEAKVGHIVFSSVEDANSKEYKIGHFDSKLKIEDHLKASGLKFTILRPVAFMDNYNPNPSLANFGVFGLFETVLQGKSLKIVSTADIGKVASVAIRKPDQYKGRTIPLAGDDLTVTQLLDTYEKVQGYRPWKAWIPSFFLKALPTDPQRMFQFFREKGYNTDVQAVKKEFPFIKNFEQWLRENRKE